VPIPRPRKNEPQNRFIARCIRQLSKADPNKDRKQIIAICFQVWRNREKASIDNMDEKQYKKEVKYDSDGHIIVAENIRLEFSSKLSDGIQEE